MTGREFEVIADAYQITKVARAFLNERRPDVHALSGICLYQCFSTEVPRNLRVPREAARGSAETDRDCQGRNSPPQFYAVVANSNTEPSPGSFQ